jgi:hypothetical protein
MAAAAQGSPRASRIQVLVTDDEKTRIEEKASAQGLSASSWLRDLALDENNEAVAHFDRLLGDMEHALESANTELTAALSRMDQANG